MRLLQKTVRSYLIYSAFILLIAIPLFYFTIQRVLQHETDEQLFSTKTMLLPKLENMLTDTTTLLFLDDNTYINVSASPVIKDSIYTLEEYNLVEKEVIPYRIIHSGIVVKGKPYQLVRKMSLLENDDLIKTILIVQTILLILLLTGLFVINRRLSISIWKPFYRTLEKLKAFRVEKDATLELAQSGVNEFNDLNESLEGLTSRTHQTFINQKQFTENASHEMQTPLAILRGKLDMLMQTANLTEEQAILIDELADVAKRMTTLNKSLLLLTKIDNKQFHETENISIKAIVENFTQQQYRPQIDHKQLHTTSDFQSDIIVNRNKMLTEILIGNLMANAIRYNIVSGRIDISLHHNALVIANTGKPDALNPERIFNRFQKDGTDAESLGLGLEIAKKITALYNDQLSYKYENEMHQFTIVFE